MIAMPRILAQRWQRRAQLASTASDQLLDWLVQAEALSEQSEEVDARTRAVSVLLHEDGQGVRLIRRPLLGLRAGP